MYIQSYNERVYNYNCNQEYIEKNEVKKKVAEG